MFGHFKWWYPDKCRFDSVSFPRSFVYTGVSTLILKCEIVSSFVSILPAFLLEQFYVIVAQTHDILLMTF